MITENGTLKVSTRIDVNVMNELSKPTLRNGIVLLVLGAIGFIVFLALYIMSDFLEFTFDGFDVLLVLFALFLFFGLFLILVVKKSAQELRKYDRVNTYEFFMDYIILTQTYNGENVLTAKIYNNQIIKAKETKNYLFFYINSSAAYPLLKSGLPQEELNTLRGIFKLPVQGNTVSLNSEHVQQHSETEDNSAQQSQSPFDEFKN